jgi:hypothetical protein
VTTDTEIEQEIQNRGLTARRVTADDVEANVASEHYFGGLDTIGPAKFAQDWDSMRSMQALGVLTFCVLVLRNGFTVTGESAPASPENFDPELGRAIARGKALAKVWTLMGYALKNELSAKANSK